MKKFTLKFKLIISLFIILLFFSIFNIKESYCADETSLRNWISQNSQSLNSALSGYSYIIINNTWQNYVHIYITNAPNTKFYLEDAGSNRKRMRSTSDLGQDYYIKYTLNNNDNNFSIPSLSYNNETTGGNDQFVNNFNLNNFINSNVPVYSNSGLSEVFFRQTPLTVLAPIVGKVELDSPLVTSLVSLLPLLIPLLISLIGFWKGWKMLLHILKTA